MARDCLSKKEGGLRVFCCQICTSGWKARGVLVGMSDPRNVAHAKKVTQEKHHHQAKGKPGKEKTSRGAVQNQPVETVSAPVNAEAAKAEQKPGDLEKSQAVLSK